MTNINSGIDNTPITTDQAKRPHDRPVTKPCINIVVATNTTKYWVHKM